MGFAPRGFLEVWAVADAVADIRDMQPPLLRGLAEGVIAVQKYYKSKGKNSFNLAVYSIPKASLSYRLLIRMLARTNYIPWERNDRSYFEVMLGEAATDEFPERIAQDVKKFFQEG
jgi:galactose-1-phosphate uridylyltransferase